MQDHERQCAERQMLEAYERSIRRRCRHRGWRLAEQAKAAPYLATIVATGADKIACSR